MKSFSITWLTCGWVTACDWIAPDFIIAKVCYMHVHVNTNHTKSDSLPTMDHWACAIAADATLLDTVLPPLAFIWRAKFTITESRNTITPASSISAKLHASPCTMYYLHLLPSTKKAGYWLWIASNNCLASCVWKHSDNTLNYHVPVALYPGLLNCFVVLKKLRRPGYTTTIHEHLYTVCCIQPTSTELSSTKQKPREVLVALSRINRTSFSGRPLILPIAERTYWE